MIWNISKSAIAGIVLSTAGIGITDWQIYVVLFLVAFSSEPWK
jgi:hypothetical protein